MQLWPRVFDRGLRVREIPVRRIYTSEVRSFGNDARAGDLEVAIAPDPLLELVGASLGRLDHVGGGIERCGDDVAGHGDDAGHIGRHAKRQRHHAATGQEEAK